MNFQDFKDNIEKQLTDKISVELLEFRHEPYSFGCGLLAYRIKGCNYRLIYDGKENELTIEQSKPHEKYYGRSSEKVFSQQGLSTENITKILLS